MLPNSKLLSTNLCQNFYINLQKFLKSVALSFPALTLPVNNVFQMIYFATA